MPSIFDYILGRSPQQIAMQGQPGPIIPGATPSPSALNPLLDDTPSARDTLIGLSQGLIAAGAPSTVPTDFASTFGKAIAGANSATEGVEDKRLKRALVNAQVTKANADIANDKAWQDMFKTPAAAATATPAAPAAVPDPTNPGAGPSSPTNPGNLTNGAGGFQAFKTPEEGVAAALKLAQSYPATYNNGQPMTLAQIEAHWSPPDNGKDPLTKGNVPGVWSGNVARAMGIDPNTPVDFNNPATGLAFTKAVHQAEHPPGSAYAPDVYSRGIQMAYGGTPGAPPAGGIVPVQAPGGQPSTLAPVGVPPAAQPAKTLPEVIQSLPPAVRQMMGAMPRKDALPLLMKYADPETHVAIDTQTGQVVFAPKNDNSGRYQPVDAMKLDIDKQRLEVERRQAAARELASATGAANSVIDPRTGLPNPVLPQAQGNIEAAKEEARRKAETAQLTDPNYVRGKTVLEGSTETAKRQAETSQLTDPNFVAGKGGVTGAEAAAKVAPALVTHQGEMVIKDHQLAQTGAEHARVGIANLDRLGKLLEQVNTNKFQGTTQQLKASAKALGVDLDAAGVGDNVGVAQAAQALSQQMALQLRDPSGGGGMPGSLSDADRQFLTTMVPAITNDPNANKLMIGAQKKLYQRQIEVAKIANDYVRSPEFLKDPAGVYAKVSEYANAHPLFDPAKDGPKAATPAPPPGFKIVP